MADAISHRGPDDHGTWVDKQARLALAHRRLSIIDLTPAGHQPMLSESGRWVITFNGEIYNHADLRAELGRVCVAPRWRGHSDTEVLLAAISAWGLRRALEKSVGMFAFGLWDRQERTLTLVRDRLGEKPLYFGWAGRTFLFGSELSALKAHPDWEGEIDRGALCLLLRLNYVPAPHAIYKGIRKLPAEPRRESRRPHGRLEPTGMPGRSPQRAHATPSLAARTKRSNAPTHSFVSRSRVRWRPTCRSAPFFQAGSIPRPSSP
jgi:asparagine synthase (glutamine-hydrolysing)